MIKRDPKVQHELKNKLAEENREPQTAYDVTLDEVCVKTS